MSSLVTGNSKLLHREQWVIAQPNWNRLASIPVPAIKSFLDYYGENPYHLPVTGGVNVVYYYGFGSFGDITKASDRWGWITGEMVPQWSALPEAWREYWVDEPYANLVAGF